MPLNDDPAFPLPRRGALRISIGGLMALVLAAGLALGVMAAGWRLGGWAGLAFGMALLPFLSFGVLEFALLFVSVAADFAHEERRPAFRRAARTVGYLVLLNSYVLIAFFVLGLLATMWLTLRYV